MSISALSHQPRDMNNLDINFITAHVYSENVPIASIILILLNCIIILIIFDR